MVTRGWNGYRNKSQHRKSTLEKKILPPFQQGFEPATFQSRVRRSNHWAIPAPSSVILYVGNSSYTSRAIFMWGVSLTHPVLFYVGSFSYIPRAILCGEFLSHTPCCFMWGVSQSRLTHPVLFYVGSFSYTPRATECGEFLLHTPCYFMWGVSLARPLLESFIRTAVKAVVT